MCIILNIQCVYIKLLIFNSSPFSGLALKVRKYLLFLRFVVNPIISSKLEKQEKLQKMYYKKYGFMQKVHRGFEKNTIHIKCTCPSPALQIKYLMCLPHFAPPLLPLINNEQTLSVLSSTITSVVVCSSRGQPSRRLLHPISAVSSFTPVRHKLLTEKVRQLFL